MRVGLVGLLALLSAVLAADVPWYHNAVIYQVYPRSFMDSDGDGIGDLNGVLDRIDYLHRLGIDAVWFSPIHPSPNEDFGYDVSDYRGINPEYGTLKDFENIIRKFTNKGIKVILDFVPNHSSTEHIWFKYSENRNDSGDVEYSKFYVWRDKKGIDHNGKPIPPNNWLSVMNSGSSWRWSEKRKQFYLHNFLNHQADFNFDYPAVNNKMIDILKFWMARGVSGFRVDAVSWLYEDQAFPDEPKSGNYNPNKPNDYNNLNHKYTMDLPQNIEIVQQWREALDKFAEYMDQEDRILIVETYSSWEMQVKYYGTPGRPGATFPFNFVLLMEISKDTPASRWVQEINGYYAAIGNNWANWVLGNHDQRRVADRWSPEWVDLLHLLSMTLKGTAITYYGEEIGLDGNSLLRWDQNVDVQGKIAGEEEYKTRSRDYERGPMPWDSSSMAGFTNSSSTWVPLAPSYWRLNVEEQETADRSHLKVYRQLVKLRKSRTLTYGDCHVTSNEDQLIFVIRSVAENPTVITVVNIGSDIVETDLHSVRRGLPHTVHLLVSSTNYPEDKKTLQTDKITLLPKSGIVVSTEIL